MTDTYRFDYGRIYVEKEDIVYVVVELNDTRLHIPLIDIILQVENMRYKKK